MQVGGNHYEGKVQHWDFCWEHKYNQFEYCVTKYVFRCFKKNGLEDLKKAQHHLYKYMEFVGKCHGLPGRKTSDASIWCESYDLSAAQLFIITCVHVGYLDEAKDGLAKLISRLEHEANEQPPREYVNPDL